MRRQENLSGAACRNPQELWLTTADGQFLRWDGEQIHTCATSPFGWLGAIYVLTDQPTIYCAGSSGTVLRHRSPSGQHN